MTNDKFNSKILKKFHTHNTLIKKNLFSYHPIKHTTYKIKKGSLYLPQSIHILKIPRSLLQHYQGNWISMILKYGPEFSLLLPIPCITSFVTLIMCSLVLGNSTVLKPTDIKEAKYCFGSSLGGINIVRYIGLMVTFYFLY